MPLKDKNSYKLKRKRSLDSLSDFHSNYHGTFKRKNEEIQKIDYIYLNENSKYLQILSFH
jgi:hypothetical protein